MSVPSRKTVKSLSESYTENVQNSISIHLFIPVIFSLMELLSKDSKYHQISTYHFPVQLFMKIAISPRLRMPQVESLVCFFFFILLIFSLPLEYTKMAYCMDFTCGQSIQNQTEQAQCPVLSFL